MVLPRSLWVCPWCRAQFVEAWRLKRHLMLSHDLSETKAWAVTDRSVYFLRVLPGDYIDEMDDAANRKPPKKDGRRHLRQG